MANEYSKAGLMRAAARRQGQSAEWGRTSGGEEVQVPQGRMIGGRVMSSDESEAWFRGQGQYRAPVGAKAGE